MLWIEFVREVRLFWDQGDRLPRMSIDAPPDLATCHVHQKLQLVLNHHFLPFTLRNDIQFQLLPAQPKKFILGVKSHICNYCPRNLKYLFSNWELLYNMANVYDYEFVRALKSYPKAVVTIENWN